MDSQTDAFKKPFHKRTTLDTAYKYGFIVFFLLLIALYGQRLYLWQKDKIIAEFYQEFEVISKGKIEDTSWEGTDKCRPGILPHIIITSKDHEEIIFVRLDCLNKLLTQPVPQSAPPVEPKE